ncbi:hypothetical protein A2Y99_03055 [Candidatus Gottesmanbacteria bacterium RBG_13_37_7]|uniref:Carbohydrate kinase PfkB domain-containing protein n=1 Tax=Candidatus Gottesmanbacteria bacterium RBG_13_37_7 TaxID=1798369 RepID=A0A1F5YI12_9BACT|nr:MAG: hypothetical protein A2Y99_03055 [Candidatus Gottesmanbacteria bacterium RBG_13_37_7]
MRKNSKALKVLSAQGFYRHVGKKGKIYKKEWTNNLAIVKTYDVVILSEEDYFNLERQAELWSKRGVISILTREEKGCTVYIDGKPTDVSGFPAEKVIDATGSGDIFTAGFAYAFRRSGKIYESSMFANALSHLSLRVLSNRVKYTEEDVRAFLISKKIHINI